MYSYTYAHSRAPWKPVAGCFRNGEVMRGESLGLGGQAPVPKETHDKHDHDGQSGNAYEEATIGVTDVTSSSHGCSILW